MPVVAQFFSVALVVTSSSHYFFPSSFYYLPKKLLPSIHRTSRYSVGSVLFPLPVYGCFLAAELLDENILFYLPISLLTISDTAAETAGIQWGHLSKQFFGGQKTLIGSLSFLITAIPLSFCWLYFGCHCPLTKSITMAFVIAIAATITEMMTLHGWDNLSVPAVVLVILLLV